MHYVLMIHAAETRFASRSKEQREALMQEFGAYTRELFATGRASDCAALESTATATTVRVRDGKRTVQDGPFAETREQLGGYYSLDATSCDEALDWASKIPDAEGCTIEVRPLLVHDPGTTAAPAAPPKLDPKAFKEYLLLIYDTESQFAALSQVEREAIYGRYRDFTASLKASGQYVAGDELDSTKKAKSLTVDRNKRVVRDGPFAETREQLGGYYRVRARDLDEAIALAARIPSAETGTIEVRPVRDTSAYA